MWAVGPEIEPVNLGTPPSLEQQQVTKIYPGPAIKDFRAEARG
jgi:hypothetical protein